MDKLFRQVSVKERLPEKAGVYNTDLGKLEFSKNPCYKKKGNWFQGNYIKYPSIWYEEVELPSDEAIRENLLGAGQTANYALYQSGHEDGANYILNTLKGEKSNADH